jgi:peptidoglycan/LPS O-acetylase OafA/YrhL
VNIVASGARRMRHIDALRGLAALLVVGLHVTQIYPQLSPQYPLPGQWLSSVAQNLDIGRVGVVLFFLISGYVIPDSIRLDRPAPLTTFAIRRFFRIYPAYWVSIPLCALATWWLWGMPFTATDFLVNLTLLQDLFGITSASGVYWTLFVEIMFYLLCIALALSRNLRDARRIAMLALSLALIHTLGMYVAWRGVSLNLWLVSLPLHFSFMLCGTLFRLHDDGMPLSIIARTLSWGLVAYLLIVFPASAVWAIGPRNNYVVASAIGLALFVAGTCAQRPRAHAMVSLGSISYSIYLFHVPVMMSLLWWLQRQPAGSAWRAQHLGTYLLANVVITVALATLVYRFVERPGIELGHRAARWWLSRAGTKATERAPGPHPSRE